MSKTLLITNSLLWAAAIIASAALKAPAAMTFLVLPTLATTSWLFAIERRRSGICGPRATGPA